MKIVFFSTAHNSLSQRAFVELVDRGHSVIVVIASSEAVMLAAVEREHPDLIVAPMLKTAIPASIWQTHPCIIVHPGIKGDRGPSSLDWAILQAYEEWGVTLLQAGAEMDAGDIWASRTFAMRAGSKSHLYRHEVTEAAIQGLLETIAKVESKAFLPEPLDYRKEDVKGRWQAPMKQADRAIDWSEPSASVLRKIRCADSFPGVLDTVLGMPCYLYGAHAEEVLRGTPGEIIATRDGAICRATGDGAVWITHLKQKGAAEQVYFKLPATQVLGGCFAMRLMHLGLPTYVVDETTTPSIRRSDLLFACSGSGETEETCLAAEKADAVGAQVVAITTEPNSRLARAALLTVVLPAPHKRSAQAQCGSVQYAGSLFEQSTLLFCDGVIVQAMRTWRTSCIDMADRHANLE